MNTKNVLSLLAALAFSLAIFSPGVYANEEEVENACMEKADKQEIPDDKYDDFVSQCIEEASKKAAK